MLNRSLKKALAKSKAIQSKFEINVEEEKNATSSSDEEATKKQ